MKLRQKLAAVLAASMVVTAVPVTTFASSTAKMSKNIAAIKDLSVPASDDVYLIVDFDDSLQNVAGNRVVFYVNSSDFKFYNKEYASYGAGATYDKDAALITEIKAEAKDALQTVLNNTVKAGFTYDGKAVSSVEVLKLEEAAGSTVVSKGLTGAQLKITFKDSTTDTVTLSVAQLKAINTAVDTVVTKIADTYTKEATLASTIDYEIPKVTTTSGVEGKASVYPRIYKGVDVSMTVEAVSDAQLRVVLTSTNSFQGDVVVGVPIYGKIDGKTPALTVDGADNNSTTQKVTLTTTDVTSDKTVTAKVGSESITVDGGVVGKITFTEQQKGAIAALSGEDRIVKIKLDKSSDAAFSTKASDYQLEGRRGFGLYNVSANRLTGTKVSSLDTLKTNGNSDGSVAAGGNFEMFFEDDQTIYIRLPKITGDGIGEWRLRNIKLDSEKTGDELSTGDISVTVSSYGEGVSKVSGTIAKVVEFATSLVCEKPVALTSGKEAEEVVVTMKEAVMETIDDKRWAKFELSEGAYIEMPGSQNVSEFIKIERSEAGEDDFSELTQTQYQDYVQLVQDVNGNITGFKVYYEYVADGGFMVKDEANELKFTFDVQTNAATAGEVKLSADSRAFKADAVKIADATTPVKVEFKQPTVKVGLNTQDAGSITIKEVAKSGLTKGTLIVALDEKGMEFANKKEDLKIKTTSTLKANVKKVKDNYMEIEIETEGKELAELTIEGVILNVDRTVPEGTVDLELGGSAISSFAGYYSEDDDDVKLSSGYVTVGTGTNSEVYKKNDLNAYAKFADKDIHKVVVADFVQVGTKNTEEIGVGGKATEAKFVIGSSSYVVNGETKTMDAKAYAQEGRTMIPVRFLCDALGLPGNALSYEGTTITLLTDAKAISLKGGSKAMIVNGVTTTMSTATTIKDGRTYVPVSEIARALGLTSNWDAATQTATFTK